MNKRIILGLLTVAIMTVFTGCQSTYHDLNNPDINEIVYADTSYVQQFEHVWQGIDVGYVFWKWENVDWDEVYDKYLPVFQAADKRMKSGQEGMSLDEYRQTWSEIITPLLDHHMAVALRRPDDPKRQRIMVRPSSKREQSADYHRSFTYDEHIATLESMMNSGALKGWYEVDTFLDDSKSKEYIINGVFADGKGDSVAYLYMSTFNIPYPGAYDENEDINLIVGEWLQRILNDPKVCALLDTRNNGGGRSLWQQVLGQFFTNKEFYFNESYMKIGFNRTDYAPPIRELIKPAGNGYYRQMSEQYPFVCLFDQHSASNGEEIPWMFSYLPGYVSVGECSCGAMGTLLLENYSAMLSGTFGDKKMLNSSSNDAVGTYYCYMSTWANVDANTGKTPEGVGMIPMIECRLDTTAFFSGQSDNQLLRAIEYIRDKK